MKNTCLVSILTTLYNREKYIDDCIQSILKSSFTEWELIIVDDNSTDNSYLKAKQYEENDERIKVYKNKINLGDYKNRNKAAFYAKGKYLKYLDSDDIIYPNSIEIMVEAMESFPDAALGLSFNVINDIEPYPQLINSDEAISSFLYGKNVLGIGPSGSIIRRDRFEEFGGFSGKPYYGDVELWVKFASKWPMVKLQPSLIWWREHEGQQIINERKDYTIAAKRYLHKLAVAESSYDLLLAEKIVFAKNFIIYRQCRLFWNTLLIHKDIRNAFLLKRKSKLSFLQLIRSLIKQDSKFNMEKKNSSFI